MQGRISRKYQMDWTRLDTSGSTQLDSADRRVGASDLRKNPLHAQRRPGSAAAMVWTVEKSRRASPPHLSRSPPSSSASISNWPKTVVEEVAQLLGAFPASAGQPLGEWGEAGDVEQQQASIDDSVGRPQLSGGPRGQQPRHVRRRAGPSRSAASRGSLAPIANSKLG